jgi:protoporphyrinogen oxidase
MERRTVLVIGAGPAGLTAAWELLDRSDVVPVVIERSSEIGGISRTARYKGNRMDIGGHRFFSKSDRVMAWWQNVLPLQGALARDDRQLGREIPLAGQSRRRALRAREPVLAGAPDPELTDEVMLVRDRLSRIYWGGRFFRYPLTLDLETLRNLGFGRTFRIGTSYAWSRMMPAREERSLEDFFINRFGPELYRTFFRDYTEKVWGVPCSKIKPEWGAQRVKGLSVTKALAHAVGQLVKRRDSSLEQKRVETSLIERFMYPKLGPGQLWEEVAKQIQQAGGQIRMRQRVSGIELRGSRIASVRVVDDGTGKEEVLEGSHVISSMPIRDLVAAMGDAVPANAREAAAGLVYRDFMTVGVLVNRLKIRNDTDRPTLNGLIADNWIYVQDAGVKVGRIQVFNNWSPYLVEDPNLVWLGLEYFCDEGDSLWSMEDGAFCRMAEDELCRIGVIDPGAVLDACVIRVPKAYPAYFGTYDRFDEIRATLDGIENLYPVGRNGMHRYNNQDHSMMTAMAAIDNILAGVSSKDNLWSVNAEEEYHEQK